MRKIFYSYFIISLFLSFSATGQIPLEVKEKKEALAEAELIVERLDLKALDSPGKVNWNLYRLGEKLFFEKALSGNRNISCSSCHRLESYSGDGLPLGVGQGALFKKEIKMGHGGVLERHTPHLINTGYTNIRSLFWDSRIAGHKGGWRTPIKELNGPEPERADLAQGFDSLLALQSVFPLISDIEMMGYSGENEIANQNSSLLAWEKIVSRVLDPSLGRKYRSSLKKAFPQIKTERLKIYHIGRALAEYIKHFFSSYNSPYDQFLRGDKTALDLKSLKGLNVFFGKGSCAICHNGSHLSNFQPLSSGAPQLVRENFDADLGFQKTSKKSRHRFLFRTPALRNVALTAPYMHSGSLESLEDVVEHYNDIEGSLNSYSFSSKWSSFYDFKVKLDKDSKRNELRRLQVRFGPFLSGLRLTEEEKDNLVHFLKVGLTDLDFKKRLDQYKSQN